MPKLGLEWTLRQTLEGHVVCVFRSWVEVGTAPTGLGLWFGGRRSSSPIVVIVVVVVVGPWGWWWWWWQQSW